MNDVQAVIFDLDGTLVDSMWIWEEIDNIYLKSKGYSVPPNIGDEITHLSFQQTAQYFKDKFNITDSVEIIMATWNTMAFDLYNKKVKLKEGALEFLTHLKSNGIKIGLATSNSITLLEATLKSNNVYDLFDSITVTDEVKKSKENPDIYLLAAKKLNVDPKSCMVFEDIIPAVRGAKKAGMRVTAVYDLHNKKDAEVLKELADNFIVNYHELLLQPIES